VPDAMPGIPFRLLVEDLLRALRTAEARGRAESEAAARESGLTEAGLAPAFGIAEANVELRLAFHPGVDATEVSPTSAIRVSIDPEELKAIPNERLSTVRLRLAPSPLRLAQP
jgi:hypothetical protein